MPKANEDADVEFLYTAGQQRLCKIIKPHKAAGAGLEDQDQWVYYWSAREPVCTQSLQGLARLVREHLLQHHLNGRKFRKNILRIHT